METRAKKIRRAAAYFAGLVMLLGAGIFAGMRIERGRQETLATEKEDVREIAVVNMDDGVTVGEEQVNYAGKLLAFPNDRFVVTGLTDARAGIENGRYAAYIVIPETFSASVVSVEDDPAKVMLSYQYNAKLSEEARLQATDDVNDFMDLFNSNIAYMYVDAIMGEFHCIQDDSSTILANDNMELERIAGIDAQELIAAAEQVEGPAQQDDIEPVELSAYTSTNSALLSDMLAEYSAAVQKGKDEYALIKEESAGVGAASEAFFGLYEASRQETEEGQARFLAEGQEKLTEAVGQYNGSVDGHEEGVREAFAKAFHLQMEADREAANDQLAKIIEDVRQDLSGNDLSGNDPDGKEEGGGDDPGGEEKGGGDAAESRKSTPGDGDKEGGEGDAGDSGDGPDRYEITLAAVEDREAIDSVVKETLDLFKAESESEEIDAVIQAYFVEALAAESSLQMARLSEEMETVKGTMTSYEDHLAEFDPMKYVEEADLYSNLLDIDENAGEMLQAVEENNSDYMLYATQMYTDTAEHTEQVRSALEEANTLTVKNVTDCMDSLAFSRQETNSLNVDLLRGFTEALPYTRVGSRDNAEVYDYIVNPVVPRIYGQPAADTEGETTGGQRYSGKLWPAAVLGVLILLCLAGIVSNLRRQTEEEEGETI